jgi:hypothetical protein
LADKHVIESRVQDPADVLDYTMNWKAGDKPFLTGTMTLVSSAWAPYDTSWAPSTAATLVDGGHDTTTSTVRVSDLTADVYVTCHGVASDGQEKDQSIKIIKKEQ